MRFWKTFGLFAVAWLLLFWSTSLAQDVDYGEQKDNGRQDFWLGNNQVKCSITFKDGKLISDRLEARPQWSSRFRTESLAVETDADFSLDVIWTGWRAPGKVNNAENPITLSKDHFQLVRYDFKELPGEVKELELFLKGMNSSFELLITYQLEEKAFYVRRKLAVRDPESRHHFLRWVWPRQGFISGEVSVVKAGGFGQPLALGKDGGGVFFGLEYPTSENSIRPVGIGKVNIRCGQEMGERIATSWIESEWAVEGLSPDEEVKLWFWKYLDRIRVAPLKPYLLYNSWYDVRAPEIVKGPTQVMNEENLLRIIESFQEEMAEKRGIKLDAFVLDDGWDVYKSDWVLSKEQFPRGLAPVKQALDRMGTALGMWFGPIGGYSNRSWRVGWMHERGYEVIRAQPQEDKPGEVKGQLCLAGKNYRQLFKKRVVDLVRNDGVGYYKWDGIQFSCSAPDHGHPVGIYSRRAVMESVIDLCGSVRSENPNIFLNITSGTWLSPWWVKYANMIWMQGYDYGYADVPSISRRDAAITYRDYVLFDDLKKNDSWFPVANLMTHGIIKGHLQKLGGEAESLDKFTDNALLYFARGVSMWELYISPDLLTEGEWNALAKSIQWAKDRFEILRSTEMIGGDPGKKMAYGYVHFTGNRGIVAARNPFIESQSLRVTLSPSLGLDPEASSLVMERVYPKRWISPRLYGNGSEMVIPLQGYETAIFELYPLEEASKPLLAGVTFEVLPASENDYVVKFYEAGRGTRILNPGRVSSLSYKGKTIDPGKFSIPVRYLKEPVSLGSVRLAADDRSEIQIKFKLLDPAKKATLAVLLEPAREAEEEQDPEVTAFLDGKEVKPKVEKQKGRWGWYLLEVEPGKHTSRFVITSTPELKWTGKFSAWLVCSLRPEGKEVSFGLAQNLTQQQTMPPLPWPSGEIRKNVKLGEVEVQ
ncbi:MAG: hypothetical protein GTO17_02660 [Candidatus Aminicenantes bacterium]|nr:hypothetical protein [Candidatus Aminicenantes bacterium]